MRKYLFQVLFDYTLAYQDSLEAQSSNLHLLNCYLLHHLIEALMSLEKYTQYSEKQQYFLIAHLTWKDFLILNIRESIFTLLSLP